MPFMVIHSTSDGASCHQQADAIDEAALLVERLRNQDGIEDVRIFRMEEISFAFRPYYKVELGMPERQAAPTSEVAGPSPVEPVVAPAAPFGMETADPTEVDVPPGAAVPSMAVGDLGPNGRRGLFGR